MELGYGESGSKRESAVRHPQETEAAKRSRCVACWRRLNSEILIWVASSASLLSQAPGAASWCALGWTYIDCTSFRIRRLLYGNCQDHSQEKDTKTHAARRILLDPDTPDAR